MLCTTSLRWSALRPGLEFQARFFVLVRYAWKVVRCHGFSPAITLAARLRACFRRAASGWVLSALLLF